MITFLLRRILTGIAVLWGIVTLLFFIFANPALGDPAKMIRGQRSDLQTEEAIRKKFNLDKPFLTQYLLYLNDLSPFSYLKADNPNIEDYRILQKIGMGNGNSLVLKIPFLRRSFQTDREVGEMILEKLPGSLILAISAMLFASFWGITLGLISSLKPGAWWDTLITLVSILGISAPSFFAGIIILWFFGVYLGDWTGLPITGYIFEESPLGTVTRWNALILPSLALGIRPLSVIIQLTRDSMIEVKSMDYIRTATAKGLSPWVVMLKHTLRNALNPVLTSISGWFASLLAGAFFIEYIFGWQGIGQLTIDALGKNDHPLVLGCAIYIGFVFVVINLLVDLLYARLDPRIRLR